MELVFKIVIVLVIGFAIGVERQTKHKAIGIRSTTLTVLGSFLFAYVGTLVGGDPARIIAQVCTGIGFLCAGVIFKGGESNHIENLTTAVLIWVLAAIGCLIALNYWGIALSISGIVLAILHFYDILIKKFQSYEKK